VYSARSFNKSSLALRVSPPEGAFWPAVESIPEFYYFVVDAPTTKCTKRARKPGAQAHVEDLLLLALFYLLELRRQG
jgi:hypothetical protein